MLVAEKTFVVALAGNPNSGKTTIFNNITGANQKVGNFPGVTVEKKEGVVDHNGRKIKYVDLPGTYSLSAYSAEELIARDFLIHQNPDIVIDIVDASNIERNLFLTTQLAELGIPIIVVLNMSDIARDRGLIIDTKYLSQLLGLPVVSTEGNKKKGMPELLGTVSAILEGGMALNPRKVNFGGELENELKKLENTIRSHNIVNNGFLPGWLALKLLEDDGEIKKLIGSSEYGSHVIQEAENTRNRHKALFGEDPSVAITDKRYGFISGACTEAMTMTAEQRHDFSDSIDKFAIHPLLGLPIFALLMYLVFHTTFTLGAKPAEYIDKLVGILANFAATQLPGSWLNSLIADGIIRGVGGVISFLPNILLLFLAIALLEDTGYMARAAFVMDRIMHKIGLHGKSFIPMLIGFGCSVPAYMGSRIIEDKNDRIVTMHVINFMSCSARLPVYILICGAFWPQNAGTVVFSIYFLGIVIAITMVKVLRVTRFKGMSSPLVMELPPYKMPTLRSLSLHMWQRASMYLRKAGTLILSISILMWFLMSFPSKSHYSKDYEMQTTNAEELYRQGVISQQEKADLITAANSEKAFENLEYSFAGRIGKAMEPIIQPLGFDWRFGIAIFSGFVAKEVIVSTMATVYGMADANESSNTLKNRISSDQAYTKLTAFSFLVFVLLYMPCMAAIAVFWRESGSLWETIFQILLSGGLAYIITLVIYQSGRLLGV